MHLALFHNPSSGDATHSREDLVDLLRSRGHRVDAYPVPRKRDPLPSLEGVDLAVVAGGDGAVGKLLLRSDELARPCTILPLGTANNVAHSCGLEGPPETLIARWPEFVPRKLDTGTAIVRQKQHFLEGVGVGLLARSMDLIERIDERSGFQHSSKKDQLYRDACCLAVLASEYAAFPVEARLDGRVLRENVLALEVLNFGRTGPGMCLAPEADPGDGYLDVVLVTEKDREHFVNMVTCAMSGHSPPVRMKVRRVRQLQVRCKGVAYRIDDCAERKRRKELRFEVRVRPGKVEFFGPPTAAKP